MIYVVGIGPGEQPWLTLAAQRVIAEADILVGWPRLLNLFADHSAEKVVMSADIDAMLARLAQWTERCVVVLASGDPMLFGIGKRICQAFPADLRTVLPGISSVQYLFAAIGLDMNDVYLTSSHGKQPDFDFIFAHSKVAMVTDQHIGPYQIAQEALRRDIDCTLVIGENLGYPTQQISLLSPDQVAQHYQMNVVVVLRERQ